MKPKLGMRITGALLYKFGACKHQVDLFAKEWPDGVDFTADAVVRALEIGLDVFWFAEQAFDNETWVRLWGDWCKFAQQRDLELGTVRMARVRGEISQAELIAAQKQAHYDFGRRVFECIAGEGS